MRKLADKLREIVHGDVEDDMSTRRKYSHDASAFELLPEVVVFPKDSDDVQALVRFASEKKDEFPNLSLTARAGGTDMSGGSINESIIVAFERYFTGIGDIVNDTISAASGVYYRDFEAKTHAAGFEMPSYPASKSICGIGGIVNNNSGGEKTLAYGKTKEYVCEMHVVLADGNEYTLGPLSPEELIEKKQQDTFEGEVYRKMDALIAEHEDTIQAARPKVSKNSAGYALWDVRNRDTGVFDLSKLFVGAQGTLGLMTEVTFSLVSVKDHRSMLVIFLDDVDLVPDVVNTILPYDPESFEVYDDNTFKLALKFFPSLVARMKADILTLGWSFLPEFWMMLRGGLPKLVLLAEFADEDKTILDRTTREAKDALAEFPVQTNIARDEQEAEKYIVMRRESFNLLREKVQDKHAVPFIDDIIVRPEHIPEFLPRLNALLSRYPELEYTVAGHLGDGNFHIIPLMDLSDERQRKIIPALMPKVHDLVLEYGGSLTAEHNDGLIRTASLKKMFGDEMIALFQETKNIFDPKDIFNPHKKVNGDLAYALEHLRSDWQEEG